MQKSAWFMFKRVREACKQGSFMLVGKAENKHKGKRINAGRGTVGKHAVIGIRGRGGRLKAIPVGDIGKATLQGYIKRHVDVGTKVYTDNHRSYKGVFYSHKVVKHSVREYMDGAAQTNGIESVWAVLKRGYSGVNHNFSAKHMRKYVDEFSFRLNKGNCRVDAIGWDGSVGAWCRRQATSI